MQYRRVIFLVGLFPWVRPKRRVPLSNTPPTKKEKPSTCMYVCMYVGSQMYPQVALSVCVWREFVGSRVGSSCGHICIPFLVFGMAGVCVNYTPSRNPPSSHRMYLNCYIGLLTRSRDKIQHHQLAMRLTKSKYVYFGR